MRLFSCTRDSKRALAERPGPGLQKICSFFEKCSKILRISRRFLDFCVRLCDRGILWGTDYNQQMTWLDFVVDPNRIEVTSRSNVCFFLRKLPFLFEVYLKGISGAQMNEYEELLDLLALGSTSFLFFVKLLIGNSFVTQPLIRA